MDYWRIAVLIGIVIFLFSAFLPLVSYIISFSLADYYGLQAGIQQLGVDKWTMPKGLEGLFITMLLYPITLILGFVAIWKRSLALAAGSLGIVCWLSAFAAVSYFKINTDPRFSLLIHYESGIFLGLIGAVILLMSFFLKPEKRGFAPVHPPLPNRFCTFCGAELSDQDAFCKKCGTTVLSGNE